jgi:hypothetical protein
MIISFVYERKKNIGIEDERCRDKNENRAINNESFEKDDFTC